LRGSPGNADLRLLGGVFAAVALGACGDAPRVGPPPEMPQLSARVEVEEAIVELVAQNLEIVWSIDFAPDGRIFLTERPGRVRIIDPQDGLLPTPWAEIDVWDRGEAGLLGLALHPAFADSAFVYVMYTYRTVSGPHGRVSRFREVDGRGDAEQVILDGIPAAARHSGGALAFGPDGKLYVGTGDATRPVIAQAIASLGGKILRINPDGSIPDDNPYGASPLFALGFRNVQGFDWDPITGHMFATMHGPTGEWRLFGRDEVNVIEPGGNYGWPVAVGVSATPELVDPLLEYSPAVAPAAAAFYDGPIALWRGDLFFATLRGEHLHRVTFTEDRSGVIAIERLWPDVYGRIRALRRGPDGYLYFGTSNHDGRGYPRPGDDQLFRVVPADDITE
jgi:quinoprotein glucose dehydrogenase